MAKKELVKKDVPGFGMAGTVMCRNSSLAPKPCAKGGCESWTVLTYNKTKVGRCANSWIPILLIEQRISTDKLTKAIESMKK